MCLKNPDWRWLFLAAFFFLSQRATSQESSTPRPPAVILGELKALNAKLKADALLLSESLARLQTDFAGLQQELGASQADTMSLTDSLTSLRTQLATIQSERGFWQAVAMGTSGAAVVTALLAIIFAVF